MPKLPTVPTGPKNAGPVPPPVPSAPSKPQPKRTLVGTAPPVSPHQPTVELVEGPKKAAGLAPTVPNAPRQAASTSPTLIAMPGRPTGDHNPALRATDPNQRAAPEGRPTAEDFQANRHQHSGTQMAGIERLAEPSNKGNRVRLVPGKVVPGTRYRILRWLGEGGMGVVYAAEHIDIERQVALKILRFDLSQEEKMAQVFRDEARAASRVGSKNIVEIYDFGELGDGRLFFCMEMIPGGDLVPPTEEDWVEPARLIGLMRQACKGLSAAHKNGIVHRDIKPENIIVVNEDGREVVKIVDFGISAMVAAGGAGESNTIAGTPHYMAPEQISGTTFDGRLDIYALGCMAYELLVGYPPFLADGIQDLLQMHLYDEPKYLLECRPDREIPKELADVIMKCLAKDPADRWQDMDDLEAALCEAQVAAGLTTTWDDLPLPEGIDPERRERLMRTMPNPNTIVLEKGNRWIVPVFAGVIALILGIGLTWYFVGGKPTDAEKDQIEQLTIQAREAGSKTQWVYPPEAEPEAPTAYQKVVELESLEGSADKAGDERGEELRDEFFDTLTVLGDRYWEVPEARGFARDYYAMAYLFKPDDTARDRSGRTEGELADFRARAATGDFSEAELSAARWLDVLAEDDKDVAAQMAEELLAMDTESVIGRSMGEKAARGAGIAVAARPEPEPEPIDDPILEDDVGETGDEVLEEPEPEPDITTFGGGKVKKGGKGGKKGNKGGDDETLGGSGSDPAKARELAEQGQAALNAGKRNEAKNLFNQAVSYDRRNAMALMGLSDVYFDTNSNQKAVLYAEKAVKAAPKNSNYRIKLGDAYFKVLRYRDALEQYEKAKSLGSSRADSRIAKAKSKIGG